MTFKACWRELKRNGKSKKGVRGEDFFIGEKELMDYLDRLALAAQMHQKKKDREAYGQTIAAQNDPNHGEVTPGDMQAVQIEAVDEPHAQSQQRNLSADFEGTVESGAGNDVGPGCVVPPRHEILAMPHVQPVDEETKVTEPTNQTSSIDTLRDPNIVPAADSPGDYAVLDSDGGCERDSIYDDDDDFGWCEPNPGGEEENETPADILFTPDFLNAVGVINTVARGAVSDDALDAIRDRGWTESQLCTPYPFMDEPYDVRPDEWMREDYSGIYEGDHGPTAGAPNAASTVLGAFLRFVRPQRLERIAGETNAYFHETLDARVEAQHVKQTSSQKEKKPKFEIQSPQKIREILPDVSGRELCIFIGLLIARTISPNKEKFAHHWKTTDEGATPRGCFGQFMKRDRFDHISRNLHFSCNADPKATTDRAWKLRPAIDVLQDTFQHSFIPPAAMAFDEARLQSMSPFNKMRSS
ncbi:hypothetical protein F441_21522 [Phytophthora nicotianae CJ01A1]|uniref:PiggyBac transposable element-derived protein domain-containing protein n=1 Tax=Phytophthora nicotianae CJ01A1 TaxID=1317063 RepID=W2VUY0_PHYNI|nr:hypothetical protein F441_21522 [Phytophthora nicotianae CJ01A1]